jgi:glucose/arabinose dehydrogenase
MAWPTAGTLWRHAGQGQHGGDGLALWNGALYVEEHDTVQRYPLAPGQMRPTGAPVTILSGMPETGDHPMHPFAIDAKGLLLINSGSATNTCESPNRQPGAKGQDPCEEAKTRGGIWAYSAGKEGQVFSPAERWAAGIRNTGGIAFDTAGRVFATQHGRDQLSQNWSALYSTQQGEELPSEILFSPFKGADFGWPTCYFDGKRHVLAPEYGGDGGKVRAVARARPCPSPPSRRIGRPTMWRSTPARVSPSPIAKVPSSPSTDRGTARPARRMAISWRSSR